MKPGELFKPYGSQAVLLYEGGGVFSVEAGDPSPFHASPLDGKIHFDPTPPMHRAWHWSDLATPYDARDSDTDAELIVSAVCHNGGLDTLIINNVVYLHETKTISNL